MLLLSDSQMSDHKGAALILLAQRVTRDLLGDCG